mgnify:CR=1 FL=1
MKEKKAKYNLSQIANYFIATNKAQGLKNPVTLMKLLKLVYITYAWYLETMAEPLVDEKAEAWNGGFVFSSLYHEFKHFREGSIVNYSVNSKYDKNFTITVKDSKLPADLSYQDKTLNGILIAVWKMYGDKAGLNIDEIAPANYEIQRYFKQFGINGYKG